MGSVIRTEKRERRQRRAVELRESGMTVRAIAGALGVSHPTVLRDLRAARDTAENAESEEILAILATGHPPRPKEAPVPPRSSQRRQIAYAKGRQRWKRYGREAEVRRLHDAGASYREIGAMLDISAATVLRDLRQE